MKTFLAIDLGTSNCRSAIFDEDMQMLSVAAQEYPLIHISPSEIESDAELWWKSVRHTIKEAVAAAGTAGKKVCSIAISSQGISFVPLDKYGKPLMNAISWLDMRAQKEEQQIEDQYGRKEIYYRTGKRATACYTLPKLKWFADERADIYDKSESILLPMDYIQFCLCGSTVTDHTMAAGTMFYDIHEQKWADDILRDQGLDIHKLPKLSWSGTAIGTILPEVAKELGLKDEVIVSVGAQDQKCAALGAGISDLSATASLGTASCITQIATKPLADPELRIPCFSYLWPGTWSFEGIINTAASSYQWFKETLAPQYSYNELDKMAVDAANRGQRAYFYPYMADMTSPFWGKGTGTFMGLSLSSDIGQMALAVMDGVSCNIKANLDVMQQTYKPVNEVRLFGGGAKSPVWCQLTADILNLPVVTQQSPETALLGAAMLAKHGYDGQEPIIPETKQVYMPIAQNAKIYEEYYKCYIQQLNKSFM